MNLFCLVIYVFIMVVRVICNNCICGKCCIFIYKEFINVLGVVDNSNIDGF